MTSAPGVSAGRTAVLLAAVLAVVAIGAFAGPAAEAQNPFGVGAPEQASPLTGAGGPLSGFFAWIAAKQSAFYKLLTEAVSALKTEPGAFWALAGMSFLYGVFHAAGPGHGKVIVSTYALADRQALWRGVVLAFVSALAQAVTAVTVIVVAAVLLNWTSMAISDSAAFLETGSYALVTLLGVWLVWLKILKPAARAVRRSAAPAGLAFAGHGDPHAHHDPHGDDGPDGGAHHRHHHARLHDHHHHDHDHHHDEGCGCGHNHAPDPEVAAAGLLSRRALAVVLSIGMRPCSGALIVLVFALSQSVLWAGIGASFAMALGTGLTVAVLATLAVTARDTAVALAGGAESPWAHLVHRSFEAAGALLVFAFGLVLLIASFS